EPSVYLAGDTVLTTTVRDCLARLQPDVSVLPAGGARFDVGAEILMDAADMAEAAQLTHGALVVNHLEALDHCPTSRESVRALAQQGGWAHRLWVPEDGECRAYPGGAVN
ncbi:MAG: MBL fold metallo-hydrolase, partial [Acidovorax sp.]